MNRKAKSADGTYTTDFFSFIAWRRLAEFISTYFKKGSSILLIGEMQNRSWTDKQGIKRTASDLVVSEAFFVDGKRDVEGAVPYESGGAGVPTFASFGNAPRLEEVRADEDLPF